MATKKVQTVLGLIDPEELGFTLTHEHLSMNLEWHYTPPTDPKVSHLGEAKLDSSTYQWISQNPLNNRDNLTLNDADAELALIEDLKVFKASGGGTIVDQTSIGLKRKHSFLKRLAVETKVNVVAGAGFYTHKPQSNLILGYSVEQMAGIIRQQMLPSSQNQNDEILCGIIGEVGLETPLHDFEKKSIRASAIVQSELKCPVLFHPPTNCKETLEAIRLYEEAGGRADKLVIAHLDWPNAREETLQLADENKTVYLEFDTFGLEGNVAGYPPLVSDRQRIDLIQLLVKDGHEDRILLSHDLWAKHKLAYYGGHGYSHLVCKIPKLMSEQGLTREHIHKFTVENPRNWLAF